MIDERLELWLLGAALVSIGFFLLWLVELRTGDASVVDVGWTVALGALSVLYAALGAGFPTRRLWLGLIVGAWSIRLASHIYFRHRGGPEDGRYRTIRENWGAQAHTFFFFFYQFQGVLATALSVPFLLIAFNPSIDLLPLETAGMALVLVGLFGESVADRQLERHRKNPANEGRTCRAGLWRYSRHPNYFFEWLIWCGIGLASVPAPYGWLGLASPVAMLVLIIKVTGIPPTENRAVESRGDDYRAYQASTSAFFPWFPKEESSP